MESVKGTRRGLTLPSLVKLREFTNRREGNEANTVHLDRQAAP